MESEIYELTMKENKECKSQSEFLTRQFDNQRISNEQGDNNASN